MTAKELAILSAETMMREFAPEKLIPEGHFTYHQGVFLSGMQSLYKLTGDKRYFDYTKAWVDSTLGEDGFPRHMLTTEPDDLQPGILLFDLYEETGDPKYKKLLDKIILWMMDLRTNDLGGIWHKLRFPNQMWLDSMFMAGVVTSRYAEKYGSEKHRAFVYRQMELIKKYTKDEETGLYRHAWDYSKKAKWADPVTGSSESFWGRAIGWFAAAVFLIAKTMPKEDKRYSEYISTGVELIEALMRYRDEKTGMWYQVVDKGQLAGNWIETSCSCLFLYAMCLAIEAGALDGEGCRAFAEKSYNGIAESLHYGENNYVGICNVCIGTGVGDGSFEHYINRPTDENDLHGVGAFLLMACKYSEIFENGGCYENT